MAFWDRFFGSAGSQAAGIAVGATAIPSLRPAVQFLENEAWDKVRTLPPTIYTTVRGVAEGKIDEAEARHWAHQQGYSDDVFDALLAGSKAGSEFGNLMAGWRRGLIGDAEFQTGLSRLGIEARWWPMLRGLKRVHLSPAEAANARQQQFITAQEQRDTAALAGVIAGDADVQFELAGLPPGVETGLQMLRRGIIDEATFDRIVAEGHTKTKYTAALLRLRRQLLSAGTAVRAHLKGHIDAAEMHARGADWGYSAADMDLWYQAEGRPATAHQIHIGYMRGADLPGAQNERDAIGIATKQSDIRPEYEALIYASRTTYPSLFQLNRLVTAGAITPAQAASWATKAGLAAEVVTVLETYWQGLSGGTTADAHVTKADSQLWTTLHKAFLGSVADSATVAQGFTLLGVAAGAQQAVLQRWTFERDLERKRLTPTQVKKALGEGVHNPATGQPWTRPEAVAYLIELGYATSDAATFLDI